MNSGEYGKIFVPPLRTPWEKYFPQNTYKEHVWAKFGKILFNNISLNMLQNEHLRAKDIIIKLVEVGRKCKTLEEPNRIPSLAKNVEMSKRVWYSSSLPETI